MTGDRRFTRPFLKSARLTIDRIGSNPRAEMGGSVRGDLQRRMRANRRASGKAISGTSSLVSPLTCIRNFVQESCRVSLSWRRGGILYFHEPRRPFACGFLVHPRLSIVHGDLSLDLWTGDFSRSSPEISPHDKPEAFPSYQNVRRDVYPRRLESRKRPCLFRNPVSIHHAHKLRHTHHISAHRSPDALVFPESS